MSRKRSRKVLYEVSSDVQESKKSGAKLEISKRMRAFTNKVESRRAVKKNEKASTKVPSGSKRKFLVFIGRFFNFSVKKALVLLAVTAAAVVFWPVGGKDVPVGQESGGSDVARNVESSGGVVVPEVETPVNGVVEVIEEVSGPPKDHCLQIASHTDLEQLKPLAKYFLENGIETNIRTSGNWYLLNTKNRYLSTKDPQTQVYKAKKRIIEIGDEYKPPVGFGSFTFDSVLIKKVSGE